MAERHQLAKTAARPATTSPQSMRIQPCAAVTPSFARSQRVSAVLRVRLVRGGPTVGSEVHGMAQTVIIAFGVQLLYLRLLGRRSLGAGTFASSDDGARARYDTVHAGWARTKRSAAGPSVGQGAQNLSVHGSAAAAMIAGGSTPALLGGSATAGTCGQQPRRGRTRMMPTLCCKAIGGRWLGARMAGRTRSQQIRALLDVQMPGVVAGREPNQGICPAGGGRWPCQVIGFEHADARAVQHYMSIESDASVRAAVDVAQ